MQITVMLYTFCPLVFLGAEKLNLISVTEVARRKVNICTYIIHAMYVHTYVYTYSSCIHMYVYILYVHRYVQYVHMYIHTYIRTYAHVYTHVCIYEHTHLIHT